VTYCGDVAYPVVTIRIADAPIEDSQCQAGVEFTGMSGEPEISCTAQETDCVCWFWSGVLSEGESVFTLIDENGAPSTTYSGPYVPAESQGTCGGQAYEEIVIAYALGAGGAGGGP
jgi:hypothetical protein